MIMIFKSECCDLNISICFSKTLPSVSDGWDSWIRTNEMRESKSLALPLGYIPKFKGHRQNAYAL